MCRYLAEIVLNLISIKVLYITAVDIGVE